MNFISLTIDIFIVVAEGGVGMSPLQIKENGRSFEIISFSEMRGGLDLGSAIVPASGRVQASVSHVNGVLTWSKEHN